jgi:hypothetical protein
VSLGCLFQDALWPVTDGGNDLLEVHRGVTNLQCCDLPFERVSLPWLPFWAGSTDRDPAHDEFVHLTLQHVLFPARPSNAGSQLIADAFSHSLRHDNRERHA